MGTQSENPKSRTDWKRVDAMTDGEIVCDEDTGPPLSEAEISEEVARGIVSLGIEDFKRKAKDALKNG